MFLPVVTEQEDLVDFRKPPDSIHLKAIHSYIKYLLHWEKRQWFKREDNR